MFVCLAKNSWKKGQTEQVPQDFKRKMNWSGVNRVEIIEPIERSHSIVLKYFSPRIISNGNLPPSFFLPLWGVGEWKNLQRFT